MLPWAALVGAAAAVAVVNDGYVTTVATVTVLWAILAVGLNVIMGYAGYLHLGLGAFYGLGAYGAAILAVRYHQAAWVPLIFMPLLGAAVGAVLGPIVLRTRGLHFAVATMAIGMIVSDVSNNWVSVTGGPIGIAGIARPGKFMIGPALVNLKTPIGFFGLGCLLLLLLLVVGSVIHRSRFVLVLRGLKSDEMLTRSFGFPTVRYKVAAFAVAGAYAAIAGVLYAYFIQYISPEPFTFFSASFQAFVVLAIGGPGLLWGPVLGAALLTGLPEILQLDPQMKLIVYGLVLLAVIVLLPRGLAAGLADAFRFIATRLRPTDEQRGARRLEL
jgi:branched-chain amino acid transport system permease protein